MKSEIYSYCRKLYFNKIKIIHALISYYSCLVNLSHPLKRKFMHASKQIDF